MPARSAPEKKKRLKVDELSHGLLKLLKRELRQGGMIEVSGILLPVWIKITSSSILIWRTVKNNSCGTMSG